MQSEVNIEPNALLEFDTPQGSPRTTAEPNEQHEAHNPPPPVGLRWIMARVCSPVLATRPGPSGPASARFFFDFSLLPLTFLFVRVLEILL